MLVRCTRVWSIGYYEDWRPILCVRASPCVGFFVWTAAKGKFLTTDNWRKWGYLCLFGMCCFKNGARFIDLLERFIW